MSPPGVLLQVAVVNLEYGGLSETLDDSRWQATMDCLREWAPDVVLAQEMNGRAPYRLQSHLWRTANTLGMTPLLGPPSGDSVSGNHPAVLVATGRGLRIADAGPPPCPAGGMQPAWCEALVEVPGVAEPVWFVSVHLPARSAVAQRLQAEKLAAIAAQRELVIVGGDFNSYADPVSQAVLYALPARLRSSRMSFGLGGLQADLGVHQVLKSAGLSDAAAALPSQHRRPPELTPTSTTGAARIDRIYVSKPLVPALANYEQEETGGSDHQALMLTLRLPAARQASSDTDEPARGGPACQVTRLDSRRAAAREDS